MVWMMWSPSSTPMATERLDVDLQGTPTDQTTYRRMIGGLMYLTASRPDIAFANFIQSYNMGLWYSKDSGFKLIAYSDSDHAGCKDDCKSTSGGLQFLGGTVHWMRAQLLDCGYKYNRILMYCDSKSSIAISCNLVQHSKTKHIDIWYHFIKEHVEKGIVELYFVATEYQLADLFTKALLKERFEYLVHRIADVHPDELCSPNKRYDFMDANKKTDQSIRLTLCLTEKLSLTLDDFRTIFHLPQANANNHDSFAPPPSFLDMVPFYKQQLGFTMELKTSSSFKTTGLLQPWQTLCKIFSKCLTTRVTGWDQPPEIQRQSQNANSRVDDFRRNEEHGALLNVSARKSFVTLVDHLQEVMVELLPTMVDTHIKEQVKRQVPEQVQDQVLVYVAEGVILERQKTKEEMERMIAKAILQERGNIQAEISS
ncbi:hypothetical protein Tco_1081549 [Tanacetum coccineum]|uniref:Uncharacterized protein n=1 Tax=Tanacetum coccineum TaxID=301880 RepID=A0ABQ5HYS7_9ASTR